MNPLTKKAKLSTRVRQDLAERSQQGVWAHPVCLILVFLTTGLCRRASWLLLVSAAVVLLQALLRLHVLRRLRSDNRQTEPRWHQLHVSLLLSCAAVWGIVPGIALFLFGYQDRDVLLLLLYHAVVTFGTINLLVHDRKLILIALALLLPPLAVGCLLSTTPHPLNYLLAAVAFFGYSLGQGRKLNRLYEQQISDNYELSVAAYQDCLTGLPNRLYMNEALETTINIAMARRTRIALLYIDLDGFKQINDRHSHKVGDLFLREAAARIAGCLRREDVAARVGGDEFTVLLPECDSEEEALVIAKRVLSTARNPVVIDGHDLHYSTSIGVSLFPDRAHTADLLVRSADEAMYTAKTTGKDRICLAGPQALAGGLPPETLRSLPTAGPGLELCFRIA